MEFQSHHSNELRSFWCGKKYFHELAIILFIIFFVFVADENKIVHISLYTHRMDADRRKAMNEMQTHIFHFYFIFKTIKWFVSLRNDERN